MQSLKIVTMLFFIIAAVAVGGCNKPQETTVTPGEHKERNTTLADTGEGQSAEIDLSNSEP